MRNDYVCNECDDTFQTLEKAQRHYFTVHIPSTGLPLVCSLPECKWWGRTTNDFTKYIRSDGHKSKAINAPLTAMAIHNPRAMAIPPEKIGLGPRDVPDAEPPKELIRPMEVWPLNTDVQQAVKRLKTKHDQSSELSETQPQDPGHSSEEYISMQPPATTQIPEYQPPPPPPPLPA